MKILSSIIAPGNKPNYFRSAGILIGCFVISRIIIHFFGLRFQYDALFKYWQYLDVYTLKHNLVAGVWYDHTQPPFFNLFLGTILKIAGESNAAIVFAVILKLLSLANSLLLLFLLRKLTYRPILSLLLALWFLLSPGTMVFENELFYTSFITFFFLVSAVFLLRLPGKLDWHNSLGFFLPLVLACLTRSMYHLFLLLLIAIIVIWRNRKKTGVMKLAFAAALSLLVTGSWYIKNQVIFDQFSTSSWLGMNMSRNVFHDNEITDSSRIESIQPFSEISAYKSFIKDDLSGKYKGLNDRDLLQEMKNDSFRNEKHINFIEVSKLYKEASVEHIKAHPVGFLKNITQSGITFFAPATRYTLTEKQARKIKYYDAIYSFNPSTFVSGKQARRIALTLSAIPKLLIYLFVFYILIREALRQKKITVLNLFILLLFGFVFLASSLLEHYENMRFRFELEPLFILLAGQSIVRFMEMKKKLS